MKHPLITAGLLSAIGCCTSSAIAQTTPAASNPAEQPAPATAAGPGVIVPLPPPETLNGPQQDKKPVFGNFQYDAGLPERALDITVRSLYENQQVRGPGGASSFLESGSHWMHDLEINARQPLGEWKTELNTLLRYADSRRYDPETWSLQRFQMIASDRKNHLTLGDYYATLSQYSLNRAIKGVGYQRNLVQGDDSNYVRVVAGTFDARWDYLYASPKDEPIDRNVLGLRAQHAGENYRIGFNLVSADDRDNDPVRTTEDIFRQTLPALDWEYRTDSGARLSGEHAYADTTRKTVAGVTTQLNGSAHRLSGDGTLGALRWRVRGERVSPNFYTMGGGAVLDRFRLYARGDLRLNKIWSVFVADDWYRNNLDNQLTATTRTHIPELGLSARGLFDRRSLTLSTALRQRRIETDEPNYQQQVSDRIYFSFNDRIDQISMRGEIETLINKQESSTTARTVNDDRLYRFAIDSRHLFNEGRLDFRPYLTVDKQVIEDPLTGKSVITQGTLLDLRLMTRNNLTYALNLERRNTDNTVPGADSSRLRRVAASVTYRPVWLPNGNLRAEIGEANYDFSDQTKDYRERYLRLTLDVPFSLGK